MTTTSTTYLAAETTADHFADATGLVEGRGFVMWNGQPTGLYPEAMALRILNQLTDCTVHLTPAQTVNAGRAKLTH